jgi:hypothetical protein
VTVTLLEHCLSKKWEIFEELVHPKLLPIPNGKSLPQKSDFRQSFAS